ncbi:1227_t:CDS:2 [Ambispora gerdemannii]|uniref:1227_t:CDS:1 n=1 Tax=Ambispora gerdemannii TaxID=144530 RepID=A0A9N9G168_9GLOM|nr:1227_t:CDS:2 [Ambispora gerdemannii]
MSANQLILKISNVVGFALVFVVNYVYPQHKGDNGHLDKILIYPALWVFKIWLPIFGLLTGFLVYQFFEAANSATVEGIKWYYIATSLLNICFVVTWHHGSLDILEFIIRVLLLGFLSKIYSNLSYYPSKNIFDRLFIHYPFTMYTAWAVFTTVLKLWIIFPALNTTLLSIFVIAVIGVTGLHFVDYHDRRDVVFSGTLAWGLVGIALNDHDEVEKPIVFTASVASAFFKSLTSVLNTTLLSILAIALIGVTGLHSVDYHDRRDVVFSGTLAWGLVGIALNDHDEVEQKPIVFVASVASGLIVGWILRLRRQRTLDETSPLLYHQ